MGVCRKIMMLAVAALLWCCNGEDTLLDQYPMEPIVNPEVGALLAGDGIIHVDFNGRQRMAGIAATGVFDTDDGFRSLHFDPQPWQAADGLVAFGEGVVAHIQTTDGSSALQYTVDRGKTWIVYDGAIVDEAAFAAGTLTPVKLSVVEERTVWILWRQGSGMDGRTLLCRVDLESGQHALVMEKEGVTALTFDVADPQHGWVLYSESGERASRVHVLRTVDGGVTWSEGAVLDGVSRPTVVPITAEKLLVYGGRGAAYHSSDGGLSFEPVTIGEGVTACAAASPSVVYAVLQRGVVKSVDGGRTWEALDTFVHGVEVSGTALDFQDERSGIVYGADRLFITGNGGQSWDVLVYPYDYVFEY